MKYQIEDIKEGMEFIIDDDKTFDELIEFYLPFRLSELSSLDPSKPGDYDFNLIEAFFRGGKSPEIEDWADKVVGPVNWRDAIRLYVALATYADKHRADRVLALDIIYCLIGLNNQSWTDLFDKQYVLSDIEITEQVTIQWGDYEIAKFLAVNALEGCYHLFDLTEYLDDSFFGAVSDLVGVECYFDRISEMIEKDKEHFFDSSGYDEAYFDDLIDVAKKSLDYLDDDTWARELYKKTLEVYDVADTESEYISEIAYSIAIDLKDKKWAEEVANSLSMWNEKKEVLEAVKDNGYILSNASEELLADKDVVMAAVKNNGSALSFASKELRADKEVVMAAMRSNGFALQYASEELRADREVVMAAVKDSGDALEYASEELRADREVVMAAVKESGGAHQYASEELQNDPEFMKEVEQYL